MLNFGIGLFIGGIVTLVTVIAITQSKICSLYEELVCLAICNSEHILEYYSYVEKISALIDEETVAYDKLDEKFNTLEEYLKCESMTNIKQKYDTLKANYSIIKENTISYSENELNISFISFSNVIRFSLE